jgi:hypothetical protein
MFVERFNGSFDAVLMAHPVSYGLCRFQGFLCETKLDCFSESFGRKIARSDRLWTYASTGTHVAPEWLISEEGNDGGRDAILQPTCRSSGSTVMYDSGRSWEQPLMWAVSNEVNVGIVEISSQV